VLKDFLLEQDKFRGWEHELQRLVVDGETVLWVCKKCLDEKHFKTVQAKRKVKPPRMPMAVRSV
jgi:hypothetical protein